MTVAVRPAAGATLGASVTPHRGVLWAALTVLIWAAYPAVTRLSVTQTLGPDDLFALRFGISALLFLPYLAWRASALPGGAWAKGIGLAACQGALAALVIVGLEFAPASHASALLQGVIPAWLLIVGALFLGHRFGRRAAWTVALIAAGVAALVVGSITLGEQVLRGDALFLLASLLACGYILQVRHYRLPAAATAAFVAVYSAIAFLPWYFLSGAHSLAQAAGAELVLQAVYQGVLIGCVSFIALNRAIAGLGGLKTSAFVSAVPVLTAIIAIPVLGEYPSLVDCTALVLITLGVALAARAPRKEDASPAP
jgi:drug/metabolite transporter (DMT)-like permease